MKVFYTGESYLFWETSILSSNMEGVELNSIMLWINEVFYFLGYRICNIINSLWGMELIA